MDLASTLNEIATWPVKDQAELAQQLWDRLVDLGWTPDLSNEVRSELDRRLDELDANPGERISWDDVVRHVKRTS